MAVITKTCGSRVTFCRPFLLGFPPSLKVSQHTNFIVFFNVKCMREKSYYSLLRLKAYSLPLTFTAKRAHLLNFICFMKWKIWGISKIIINYEILLYKKKNLFSQKFTLRINYSSTWWNQLTFTMAENPQKWLDKWRLQWPKQSPNQLFWGLPSYAGDTIC